MTGHHPFEGLFVEFLSFATEILLCCREEEGALKRSKGCYTNYFCSEDIDEHWQTSFECF